MEVISNPLSFNEGKHMRGDTPTSWSIAISDNGLRHQKGTCKSIRTVVHFEIAKSIPGNYMFIKADLTGVLKKQQLSVAFLQPDWQPVHWRCAISIFCPQFCSLIASEITRIDQQWFKHFRSTAVFPIHLKQWNAVEPPSRPTRNKKWLTIFFYCRLSFWKTKSYLACIM